VRSERTYGDLKRALFVADMNWHKARVKDETKARLWADVLTACEALVEQSLRDAYRAGFLAACAREPEDFDRWKQSRLGSAP